MFWESVSCDGRHAHSLGCFGQPRTQIAVASCQAVCPRLACALTLLFSLLRPLPRRSPCDHGRPRLRRRREYHTRLDGVTMARLPLPSVPAPGIRWRRIAGSWGSVRHGFCTRCVPLARRCASRLSAPYPGQTPCNHRFMIRLPRWPEHGNQIHGLTKGSSCLGHGCGRVAPYRGEEAPSGWAHALCGMLLRRGIPGFMLQQRMVTRTDDEGRRLCSLRPAR
jgi:hypothetical protein